MPLVFEVNSAEALLHDIIQLISVEERRHMLSSKNTKRERELDIARAFTCTFLIGLLKDAIIKAPPSETSP